MDLLDAPRGNHVCGSIDDLQGQLHNFLLSKSSNTRAEHVSVTFELRYNTVFYLTADSENGGPDGMDPAQSQQQQVTRTVTASETIQNQPPDDPALQKAVAKHIINKIGMVDNSSWAVRQVSRSAQGWTFTYICRDSLQAWNRANAKNPERPVIGGFSGNGGLDPINLSRPAFDCRGTLSIAFSKSGRGVMVKYDHTLLHKTVSQLADLLAPAPAPVPVNNGGSTRTPKAKRPPPAEGEEGSRKKRAKKKGKAPEAPMDGGGLPADGQQPNQNGSQTRETSQGNAQIPSALNVPPAEAARRKETAVNLLTGKGIDPATLSAEQFNIFANQAPQLQEASLEMLAKYGAERLRIVHPDDKEQAGTASSTPAQAQSATATPNTGAAVTPSTDTPTKKKRSKKKSNVAAATELSIGDGAVVSLEQNGEVGTTESTLKPGRAKKTRGACAICKQKKVKCTKEHPACSVCQQSGEQCVYLPPKPRRKSQKSGDVAEQDDSDLPNEAEERLQEQASIPPPPQPPPAPAPAPAPALTDVPAPVPAPVVDPDNEEFIPDPNILTGPVDSHGTAVQPANNNYYQTNSGGLTFPPAPQVSTSEQSAANTNVPGLTFPPSQARGSTSQSSTGLTFPPPTSQPEQAAYSQSNASSAAGQRRQSSSTSSRRSLPTSHVKQTPVPPPTVPMQTSSWNSSPATGTASNVSPIMTQQAPKRPASRKSGVETNQQTHDGMQQAAALSQAAVQTPSQQSPMTRSPYQSAARAKSRQGHRSRTNTPVNNTSATQPPPQPAASHQSGTSAPYNTASNTSTIPNYDPYARYSNTSTNQYSNTNNDHSSSRIPYEPGSYHNHPTTTTSTSYSSAPSAPAYDYSRSPAPGNPLSQALNTSSSGYGSTNSPTQNWPTSQARTSQAQSSNSYMSSAPTSSAHGYGNPSDQRNSTSSSSYTQPQQQPYSYSSHPPTTSQPSQQNWYGFASNNNQSSYSSNRSSGYSGTSTANNPTPYQSHRPNVSGYSGHGYGGSDEQSIYDLLRASGSGN